MRFIKLLLALGVAATLLFGGIHIHTVRQEQAAAKAAAEKKAAEEAAAKARMDTIRKNLTNIIEGTDVSTAVSVIDLANGKSVQAGLDVVFRAASTTKVLSVAAFMHDVEEGKASLDTRISGSKARTLLERMLRDSDNEAWAAINDYIGDNQLTTYAQSLDISSYTNSNNAISASDMALLFKKLYKHELMSEANTKLILSFMQNTNNEDLIPAALPQGATVHHKFGLYEGELHDAAIISYQGYTFVLVIFTNNEKTRLDDEASRVALIHELTTAVIDGFTQPASSSTDS